MRKTPYTDLILAVAPGYDWRHVEAYMRVEHGTLDALTPARFRAEARVACECIDMGGLEMAERLALSYGFTP